MLSCALWLSEASAGASGKADASTTIVLAQATPATAPAAAGALEAALRETVGAWASAWSAQDVERYLGFYAPSFKPADGQSHAAWEKLRRARVGEPSRIEVTIDDVRVLRRDENRAAATFEQKYRSNRHQDSVTKTLEFVRDGARWLIAEENVGAAAAHAPVAAPNPAKAAAPVAAPTPVTAPAQATAPAPGPAPAATPVAASASGISAGLGNLTVLSYLGQPLRAEIDLVSLRSHDKDNVNVRLAAVETFQQAGMTFHPALSRVAMAIELREGKPVVVVTTRDAIREPILDLIVELEWGSGRFVREYAMLLDLPAYRPRSPSHTVTWPTPSPAPRAAPEVAAAPPPAPAQAVAAAPRPAAASSTARTAAAAPGTEYRVKPGDTLAKIANAQLHPGVTLDQMLIALYRGNIGAFVNDDMNVLLAGHVLKIPDRDTVAAIDPDEATRAVAAQMAPSAEGRRAIARAVPAAPRAEAPRAIAKPAPTPDQVKLARLKEAEAAEAAAREDDRIARDRALTEAKTRIAELEKIVADLRKLLEIRNQRLAELEKRAAKAQAASPVAPVTPVTKPAVEAPTTPPVATAPRPTPAAEPPKPAPPAAKPAPAPPKPAAKPRPSPPPEPEPGLVERYIGDLGDPVMLGGLGGVVLLLIGYGAYAWRKKKRVARAQLSESLLGASAGGAATMAAASAASAAAVAAASASDEADPLEEADVYLAYGRDAQAEALLREAVEKGETRPVAYSKLLQIYAKQHDTKRFESIALKLKGLVHDEGPEWEKAMALGRSIDPNNGLYGEGKAAEVATETPSGEEPGVDFDLDAVTGAGEAQAEAVKAPAVDFAIDTTSSGIDRTAPGMDFDLGTSTTEMPARGATGAAERAEDVGSIDFDLGGMTTEQPAPEAATPSFTTEEAPEHIALEFDLGEATGEKPAEEPPPAAPAEKRLDTITFDLGGTEIAAPSAGAGDAKWQEVTTKLQLAKSFEEIGDAEGARELLKEVIAEGDAAQRAYAEKMLAGLE